MLKYVANANATPPDKDDEHEKTLDEGKLKDFVGDFNKFFEDLAKSYKKDAKKIEKRREHFWRKYPEIFKDSSENEVEMNIDEGKTRPKKLSLGEIKERLLRNKTTDAFTDYHAVQSDPNLTLVERMIKLQNAIDDATRRKIHYASLLGELLQGCFNESKETYDKTLEEVKIKRRWAEFLRKLHRLVLNYNQLLYCTVPLRFIQSNFKAIEEICESEPDNWK